MANTRESGKPRQTSTRTRTAPANTAPEKELLAFIPEKFRSASWIVLLLLTLVIFFSGVIFGGEYFASNDNISWESYRPYLNQMADQGESPQWMPYIFSGMPGIAAYMVTGERTWDISMWMLNTAGSVFSFVNSDVMRVLFYYFLLGIGVFALMRHKKISRPVAFFSAFGVLFSTWIIVWIMIGHNTKPMTLAFVPWAILFLDKLIDRWSVLYAGLLILAVHFVLESAHPQTAFYGAAAIGIWLLTELIGSSTKNGGNRRKGVFRAAAIGLVAAGLAFGMGMDRFLAVQEYNPYSTRGASSIIDTVSNAADAKAQYEYTTNWSFDVDETFTYVVPAYFGFGELELDVQGLPQEPVPTYWGNMPFTDAAHYMGIAVLILGLFGLWRFRRNMFVLGLGLAGFFGLIISYGKNFPLVYDILYNILPLFDKFRAPSQSLVILEFVFPILAGFGLQALIDAKKKGGQEVTDLSKKFLYGGIASGVFLLIGAGASGIFKSSYISAVTSSSLANVFGPQGIPLIAEELFSVMMTDWIVAGLFAALFCLTAWAYLQRKMSTALMQTVVIALLLFDLWRIDYRPMTKNQPKDQAFAVFNTTDVDTFLKQDTTQYRIADVRQGGQYHPSYPAYHLHQHIGGYSAAKVRVYQDLMDVTANGSTSMPGPGLAWDILNTRYVLASQPSVDGMEQVFASQQNAGFVFRNPRAMPRAWFVDRVEVADGLEILTKIKNNAFNPWEVAWLLEPLETSIDPVPGTAQPAAEDTGDDSTTAPPVEDFGPHADRVQVTQWSPHEITIQADAAGTNFLVVSEIVYPPGWHATIDGNPTDIIQANYLLRGIVVPQGKHEIRFEYRDEGFETGKMVSLILNILMFALIGGGIFLERRNRKDTATTEEEENKDEETA